MQQKLNRVIFLVLGMIMGIGGTMFFGGHSAPKQIPAATIQSPADLKNTSVLVEAHFQGRVDLLMSNNSNLNRKISNSRSDLQKEKQWVTLILWGLSKEFMQSEQEEFGISDTSLVSSKQFYFGVERLCICISISVCEEVEYVA